MGVRREECVEKGGVGETRSSRHSRVGPPGVSEEGFLNVLGPDVVVIFATGEEAGAESEDEGWTSTNWKAWMGRASKNSWAIMKGVFSGSITG